MNQSLVILGRQPAFGLAELESLHGANAVTPAGQAALLAIEPSEVAFARLGGAIKLCKLLTILETTKWRELEKYLLDVSPEHAKYLPEGKMHLGLSVYDIELRPNQLLATGLRLKKTIQAATGRTVRLVPNKTDELNAATVVHNKLIGPNGWELVILRDGSRTILAQTTAVQDIDAYSDRDFGRPKRDARVGMLPPKLAQTIVNLAVGDTDPRHGGVVLDPFCGTGVVLQEATLIGFDIYGSDLDPRMVSYTDENLMWLLDKPYTPVRRSPEQISNPDPKWRYFKLEPGDATSHRWSPPPNFVASETYLGRAFTSMPTPDILAQTIAECNLIIKKFLQNIHPQLQPGVRLCLAIPAWHTRSGEFKHLPLIDLLSNLGYNQVRFEHVRSTDLLYYRPDQIVARELLVITRK